MVKLEMIEQLREQASSYASTKSKEVEEWRWVYENKFAELIVRECADHIMTSSDRYRKEHFAHKI